MMVKGDDILLMVNGYDALLMVNQIWGIDDVNINEVLLTVMM